MSTNSLVNMQGFLPKTQPRAGRTIFGTLRMLWEALAEAKSAADHYQTLIARGTPPQQASAEVLKTHFGCRH